MKLAFPGGLLWKMPADKEAPAVYLTFDDGPHPIATHFILQQLEQHNGKGTFFCIGKNVQRHRDIYQNILDAGHRVGNHTQNHVNGKLMDDAAYLAEIGLAANVIDTNLFRPPYGRIRRSQAGKILRYNPDWQICMWDVLSGDFDVTITAQQCLNNVLEHIRPGSIVVFHDSEKAWPRLSFALPRVLDHCQKKGWAIKALP